MGIVPVVLAGGVGARLWPLSREAYSKPFISLDGGPSLFQTTIMRLQRIPGSQPGVVVCQENQRFLAKEQLQERGAGAWTILLEPQGRGTAPATACAALWCAEAMGEGLLLVSPADHRIDDDEAFYKAVARGVGVAEAERLVLFGVAPDHGECGFGYIRKGDSLGESAFQVAGFVEKPDPQRATAMAQSGDYYWNSGLFLFRGGRYLEELARFAPAILQACQRATDGISRDLSFLRLDEPAYRQCPADSIDWAVMEKTRGAAVVPLAAGWSDVGSWSALWQSGKKDAQGNVASGDVVLIGVEGSLVHSESRLVAVLGCRDLVVVDTGDALLVADRHRCQEVKELVARLQGADRPEASRHHRVYRPWGMFEIMDQGEGFLVKRLTVHPGASISRQYHRQRQEHWVVVRGVAKVCRGEEQFSLQAGESAFIPMGTIHRLVNPGPAPLEIVEVQTGAYLGEDDIIRLDDLYGRCSQSGNAPMNPWPPSRGTGKEMY